MPCRSKTIGTPVTPIRASWRTSDEADTATGCARNGSARSPSAGTARRGHRARPGIKRQQRAEIDLLLRPASRAGAEQSHTNNDISHDSHCVVLITAALSDCDGGIRSRTRSGTAVGGNRAPRRKGPEGRFFLPAPVGAHVGIDRRFMAKVNTHRPVPPKGTRLAGEALWAAVLDRYELEQHELLILREIVRCVDDLDRLANVAARQGAITANGVIDPAIAEARQMRITLATLIGALRLPAEDEQQGQDEVRLRRPQRRAVVRSVDPFPAQAGSLPPQPPLDRRVDVSTNAAPTRPPAARSVVRAIHPPAPPPGRRHISAERPARSSQISVAQLVARVRGDSVPSE